MVDKFNDGKDFDGMVVHSSGNIFTSGPGGLLVISPEGELQARIDFGHITNCTLDTNENYLYVTGFLDNPKVYRIKLKWNFFGILLNQISFLSHELLTKV